MSSHVDCAVQKPIGFLSHPVKLLVTAKVFAEVEGLQVVKIKRLCVWTSSHAQALVYNVSWIQHAYSVTEEHKACLISISMLHLRVYRELAK